jgi:RHS repeat-associated protein
MKTLTKAGITTTYTYDNDGRRVRKFDNTGAASTVVFFHDLDGHLLGEFDQTGKAIREFVWLGDTLIAVFTPDPVSAANPPLVYYVHSDHLNTPRVIVDKNNAIRWRWFAEPFGTTAAESNPSNLGNFTFNLRFPGQYFDQESGLHYNWHRYYDPTSGGRYTTSDPIGLAGGINTYLYSQAAPTMYTDPTGLFTSSTHNEITTAAIAIAGSPCQNLPAAVANADWFPGSQAPQNAHWHAMRDGTNPSATVDSARRDYNDFVDGQWKSCTCEGLARAMHAVQDSYARGHANFQPWSGGLPSVSHAHADGYPSRSEREGAINASVELIRRHGKECKEQCPR